MCSLQDLLRYTDDKKCRKELQEALDCMLIMLKCVNDSMHQIAITGFWVSWSASPSPESREVTLRAQFIECCLYLRPYSIEW
jgi:hypothetical protein